MSAEYDANGGRPDEGASSGMTRPPRRPARTCRREVAPAQLLEGDLSAGQNLDLLGQPALHVHQGLDEARRAGAASHAFDGPPALLGIEGKHGPAASIGVERNAGTRLFGVSGHVVQRGVYELPMGTPLRELIYQQCGGMRNGRKLKAIVPGGSSVPVLTADQVEVPLDFDSVAKAGSMLGSAGVIVMDDSTCMVKAALRISKFYAEESCGQCTQCREGTEWLHRILTRLENGNGRHGDLELMLDICANMKGKTICPLSDAAAMPIESYIQKFYDEFAAHIQEQRCVVA